MKIKRLYGLHPKHFTLILIHSRPMKSLTAFLKYIVYLTLTLLVTRSKRNQLLTYLPFSRNTSLHWTKYENGIQSRRKICKKTWYNFLDRLHSNCDKQPSDSCYPSCTPSGRIRSPHGIPYLWILFLLYNV